MDQKARLAGSASKIGEGMDKRTLAEATAQESIGQPFGQQTVAVPVAPEPGVLRAAQDAVPAEWQVGNVILDLYEVTGLLGEGGMGKVYKVHHKGWHLDLAVKCPRPEIFSQAGGQENFVREAETWVNLGLHPHTVGCYYVRTLGGIPRVFAECVEGGSLADWIHGRKLYEGGPANALGRILDIAIQFARGLQYAHEKGLIHQDVKPANVMMTPEGTAKVTDFGLAKARGLAEARAEAIPGGSVLVSVGGMTPAYCSPEQAQRKPLSLKTDIWSWGLSVLEMFTGEVTWMAGQAASEALESYVKLDVEEGEIPKMPSGMVELLRGCFERDVAKRPQGMGHMVGRLREVYREVTGVEYGRPEPNAAELPADGLNNRAVSLLDLGRREEAESVFEKALKLDPLHPEATYNRGLVLWRTGRMTDEALVNQLEEVRTSHRRDWRNEYYLGLVHIERGDADAAIKVLEEAAHQASEEKELQRAQATALDDRDRWHRCLGTFRRHTDIVRSVTVSPDGCWGLSGIEDKTLRLWELTTGRCVRTFEGHTQTVKSIAISPDGRWALSGSGDKTLRLWELSTGQCARTFQGHEWSVDSVAISPDGLWGLSGSEDRTLRLWNLASGECTRAFEGHTNAVNSIAISPDGRCALSGSSDKTLRLWELATGKCLRTFEGHTGGATSVAIFPDGSQVLSGSSDGTLKLWDASTGRCVRTLEGLTYAVRSIAIGSDGHWALSGSQYRTLTLWELATGRCRRTWTVTSFSIDPYGRRLLLEGNDRTVSLWDLREICEKVVGRSMSFAIALPRSAAEVSELAGAVHQSMEKAESALKQGLFAEGAKELAVARSVPGYERHPSLLELWLTFEKHAQAAGVSDGWCVRQFVGHQGSVNGLFVSADARWAISGGADGILKLWRLSTGQCLSTLEGHSAGVKSLAISPDTRWALSASNRELVLWELPMGRITQTVPWHDPRVESMIEQQLLSPQVKTLMDAMPLPLKNLLGDRANPRSAIFESPIFGNQVHSLCIGPDGKWGLVASILPPSLDLSQGSREALQLWELKGGRCIRNLEGHSGSVYSVCLSPNSRCVVSVSTDKTIKMWDVATGECMRTLEGPTGSVHCVAASPDGRWLLSGSGDGTVKLWELSTGTCVRTLQGHTDSVPCVAVSHDGRWVLSGSKDRTVRIWELSTGECVRTLKGHTEALCSVAISPDGRWALSGDKGGFLRQWELVWDYEFLEPADWDERASPYMNAFLTLHCSVGDDGISRVGKPVWNDEDFKIFLKELQLRGFGWLRPDGVRKELEGMTKKWKVASRGRKSWFSNLLGKAGLFPHTREHRDGRANKRDAQAWSMKGQQLCGSGRFREAIACFDKALQLNPQDVDSLSNKGSALAHLRMVKEATACYDGALKLNPRHPNANYNKGNSLLDLGRFSDAIICYDKALASEPRHIQAWNNKGIALINLGKPGDAVVCCDRALALNRKFLMAWYNKGTALAQARKKREAIESYNNVIKYAGPQDAAIVARARGSIKSLGG